jgi:hypothetical protein
LSTGTEGIPDWFEQQIRGPIISFWFRKEIPSIVLFYYPETCPLFLLRHEPNYMEMSVNLFINGYEYKLSDGAWIFSYLCRMRSNHTYLFDLKLEEMINHWTFRKLKSKLDEALSKNEWIQVEVKWEGRRKFNYSEDDKMKLSCSTKIGIHVFNDERSMEGDVMFTGGYGKRKSDENLITSLSQLRPLLKKQRLMDIEVSETELVHKQQRRMALSSLIPIGSERMARFTESVFCSILFLFLLACFLFCYFVLENSFFLFILATMCIIMYV